MQKLNLRDLLLLSISVALLSGWLTTSIGFADYSHDPDRNISLMNEVQVTPTSRNFLTNTITPTPHATSAINLPIVQQDASLQNSEPQDSGEQTPLPTITPTPAPPQTVEDNAPIVLGAVVIVLIIILAWLIVGRRIFEKR
jgi:hypothetical protein